MRNRIKILIVDDEKLLCECLTDILEAKGYEIDSVNSGNDAIVRVKDKFFDVILMDIKMPVMNGVDTLNKIKKISPKTVVIMMTAYSTEDLINAAFHNGAFGFLNKPLDVDEVVEQIELATEKGILILITDDYTCNQEIFKDSLEAKGYKVSMASTGKEAIEIAKESSQNILFVDMKLAALNGLEIYLSIKEINPHILVVIISTRVDDIKEWINEGFKENLYSYFNRPLDINKCLELIEDTSQKLNKWV